MTYPEVINKVCLLRIVCLCTIYASYCRALPKPAAHNNSRTMIIREGQSSKRRGPVHKGFRGDAD